MTETKGSTTESRRETLCDQMRRKQGDNWILRDPATIAEAENIIHQLKRLYPPHGFVSSKK